MLALGHGPAGEWAEWGLPGIVGTLGVLQAFGLTKSLWWAFAAIGVLAGERALSRFRRGSALYQLVQNIRRINTSFAGNLDSILVELLRDPGTRLSEARSKALCIGLLGRLRGYAELSLACGSERPLRATLSVPVDHEHGPVELLRTWCYDEPYHDRRWSEIPLHLEGAPAVYRTGTLRILPDVHAMEGIEDADQRPYRSVVSVPVRAGGPNGRTLGVVNLDTPEAEFFRKGIVEETLIPMIQPVVNTLALVLALRKPGEPYEFGS